MEPSLAGSTIPFLIERIDAAHDVPHVADAEVADVERAECGAVAGAAAIVWLENERAL